MSNQSIMLIESIEKIKLRVKSTEFFTPETYKWSPHLKWWLHYPLNITEAHWHWHTCINHWISIVGDCNNWIGSGKNFEYHCTNLSNLREKLMKWVVIKFCHRLVILKTISPWAVKWILFHHFIPYDKNKLIFFIF